MRGICWLLKWPQFFDLDGIYIRWSDAHGLLTHLLPKKKKARKFHVERFLLITIAQQAFFQVYFYS